VREVKKKISIIAAALLAVAMLTTSALAAPTKGQKVPIELKAHGMEIGNGLSGYLLLDSPPSEGP
jgi:hypothetical protein